MIKNLKNKFLICLFLLVIAFSITSSCYALNTHKAVISIDDIYSSTEFISANETLGRGLDSSNSKVVVAYQSDLNWYWFWIIPNTVAYVQGSSDNAVIYMYDSNGNRITSTNLTIIGKYDLDDGTYTFFTDSASYSMQGAKFNQKVIRVLDITNVKVLYYDGTVYFEPAVDTSYTYKFEGVKRGQVKLTINDLDSSLRMYGYVGLNKTFNIGDTLDTTANINNLRLMATRTDNSDLYCYVYEGEEVNYYIVDENNVILDTGYISEMAKGYFLYGFEVSNGVDFVFLKDGQVYWSNNLSFKYALNNSIIGDNNIVSSGSNTYIISDKTVSNGEYIAYVYDSNNNLLSEASCKYSNNLSSFSIKVDTSYEEDNDFFDEGVWYINFIDLDGTNSDGTLIDFSDYYIRWSVPTNIEILEIRDNNGTCDKRNGIFDSPSSIGYFSCFWSIRDYISKYKSDEYVAFDITLQVYDGDDNLILTHIINSDDIVEDKIASEENNVDKGDYGILDNPGYTGGSSNSSGSAGNISNIQNWTADDYINLMSTDNFVWEFFKAILGNLPWWITTPLTILIFGVVIITLIRFARGA